MSSIAATAGPLPEETATGIPNGKLGTWLFLASEVMLQYGIDESVAAQIVDGTRNRPDGYESALTSYAESAAQEIQRVELGALQNGGLHPGERRPVRCQFVHPRREVFVFLRGARIARDLMRGAVAGAVRLLAGVFVDEDAPAGTSAAQDSHSSG